MIFVSFKLFLCEIKRVADGVALRFLFMLDVVEDIIIDFGIEEASHIEGISKLVQIYSVGL